MNDEARDRVPAIEALLLEAGEAHHVYERDELGDVYDADWPAWYGRWAVEHGLGALLGREVGGDAVAAYFARTWAEVEASGSKLAEPWATWMARRMVTEL